MKQAGIWFAIACLMTAAACAPVVIGGAGVGTYKVATDERSAGGIWDDATITSKVNARLVQDPVVKARQIDVDAIEGTVYLNGVVESQAEADRAVIIASETTGVRAVKPQLQIGSKTFGQSIDDKVIGSSIKARLIKEPGIRSLNIDVDVDKGVAVLIGSAKSAAQKNRIVEIARSTSGVVRVVDNIQLNAH